MQVASADRVELYTTSIIDNDLDSNILLRFCAGPRSLLHAVCKILTYAVCICFALASFVRLMVTTTMVSHHVCPAPGQFAYIIFHCRSTRLFVASVDTLTPSHIQLSQS